MSLLGLGLAASAAACGDDGNGGDNPDAMGADEIELVEIAGTFAGPESAHWDSVDNVWYVANFGQNLDLSGMTPDQPGYISRVAADGTVMDERFVELDGDFLGMAIMDGTLYVSHGIDLIEVNLSDGSTNTIAFQQQVSFLNDVAAGNGVVYVSDTATNTIYSYTPGGEPEVFSQDPALAAPNGLFVDGNELVVNTLGAFPPNPDTPGGIFRLDATGAATRLGRLAGLFDGMEKLDDSYVVSDFGGAIYLVNAADGTERLVENFAEDPFNLASTADIGLDPTTRTIMVPDLAGNKLFMFTLP